MQILFEHLGTAISVDVWPDAAKYYKMRTILSANDGVFKSDPINVSHLYYADADFISDYFLNVQISITSPQKDLYWKYAHFSDFLGSDILKHHYVGRAVVSIAEKHSDTSFEDRYIHLTQPAPCNICGIHHATAKIDDQKYSDEANTLPIGGCLNPISSLIFDWMEQDPYIQKNYPDIELIYTSIS